MRVIQDHGFTLSLSLQVILICFSPLRKHTPRRLLIMLVWFSYLLADWTVNFALILISRNQGKEPKPHDPPRDEKLMALWAPFLLLHLGGPDTITAFSLEDNALWRRHVFGLVFQATSCVSVVFQSLPNSLWVIILLVFISGTIKYLERATALYSASLDKFRDSMIQAPDPGPNYAKLMEEYKAKKEARLPTKIILIDEPAKKSRPKKLMHPSMASKRKELTHLEIAQHGYKFFNTFKGLVVDQSFSFKEHEESLEIFDHLNDAEEALRIIEIELCYQQDETISEGNDECDHYSNREFSKILSDYMMYLMVLQPGLMSEVAGIGKIRFRDAMAEADKFFLRRHIEGSRNLEEVSKTILEVNSDMDPKDVRGDRNKSVLFDASRLAKDLMKMEEKYGKDKWEIVSKVWVELLCYAACHCASTAQVEQLSRGGDLINFVWLLMAHFGLTTHFQMNKVDARAKLIIGK